MSKASKVMFVLCLLGSLFSVVVGVYNYLDLEGTPRYLDRSNENQESWGVFISMLQAPACQHAGGVMSASGCSKYYQQPIVDNYTTPVRNPQYPTLFVLRYLFAGVAFAGMVGILLTIRTAHECKVAKPELRVVSYGRRPWSRSN